jgi:hypothetical protein
VNIKNVAIILLFFSNYAYSAPPTIEEYQDNNDIEAHNIYIYGLERGLEWANEYMFQKHSIEIYCKPSDLSLSSKQLRKIIDKAIQANVTFYAKYKSAPLVGLALRNGYIDAFPCN